MRVRPPCKHLEDASEEPQGGVDAIPSEREDQGSIELVAIAPPSIPVSPFLPRASQDIYRMVLPIPDCAVKLAEGGIDSVRQDGSQRDVDHGARLLPTGAYLDSAAGPRLILPAIATKGATSQSDFRRCQTPCGAMRRYE